MAKAVYWQKGQAIDYVATKKVEAGEIVPLEKSRCGVAGTDMENGELGSLYVEGVFIFPKATGAEIKIGAPVYFAADAGNVTATAASNIPLGWAIEAAGTDATEIKVKL